MLEVGIFRVAEMAMAQAKREAHERVQQAAQLAENALGKDAAQSVQAHDASQASASSTVGKECVRFQAMRVGYFAADSDSSMALFGDQAPHHLVLNRIVSLKEDAGKSK